MDLNGHTHLLENQAHLGANVLVGVHGRNGKVAALYRGTVGQVAAFVVNPGRPTAFLLFDLDPTARHIDVPGDAIEDEELWLWAEICGVTGTRRL